MKLRDEQPKHKPPPADEADWMLCIFIVLVVLSLAVLHANGVIP